MTTIDLIDCPTCSGTGRTRLESVYPGITYTDCKHCNGKKKVLRINSAAPYRVEPQTPQRPKRVRDW